MTNEELTEAAINHAKIPEWLEVFTRQNMPEWLASIPTHFRQGTKVKAMHVQGKTIEFVVDFDNERAAVRVINRIS